MEKCRPALVVVHQTKIAATAVEEKPNDNLSVPYGLIRTVRHYLEFVGILRYIRGLKTKGVRLDLIVVALCTYTMYASNSMNACAEWLENPAVRKQLGFSAKEEVSQRTLNRALEILGQNREGIITELWNGIRSRFEIDDYDINLDGSAVVLYGPKSDYAEKGYGRDKNRGKMQVEFMVAQLASLGIPIYIKPYKGNVSDEEQYRDCVPELAGLISGKGLHALDDMKAPEAVPQEVDLSTIAAVAMLGAAIAADNGAASDDNVNRIKRCGFEYVTRVPLNKSDDKHIMEHPADFEYIGDGMMCYTKHFASSGRTTFLFLSRDLLERGRHNSRRRLEKDLEVLEDIKNGKLRKSDFVKVKHVPWVDVDVTLTAQSLLMPHSETDKERLTRDYMGLRCGFFKLETNRQMTASEALRLYRRRAGIEHVISSLKRITGIKPIRVWNEDSVNGAMVLALLSEASVAMARYCMEGREEAIVHDGLETTRTVKPSTESIVRSLIHLTLTRFRDGKGPYRMVLSNWEPVSREILDTIRLHEAPEWGFRKVPIMI